MYDIIIIGAGPAGMTAALNCIRGGKTVLVLESDSFGGQIAFSPRVENYPTYPQISGAELMDKLYDQISEIGAVVELEKVENVAKLSIGFSVTTDYNTYTCKSIIIATGVKPRTIGVAREDELVGHGVSYCAICDGAFFSGEDVAVIGDANTALQYSLLLSNFCTTVHICTLFDKFFADRALIDAVLARKNIKYYHNLSLTAFVGDPELEGLQFVNTIDNTKFEINAKAAFICIGQVPNNKNFEHLVALDNNGYIVASEDCSTSCKGIFVAGDCRTKKIRQLVTAASDGSIAAFYACMYVDAQKEFLH